MPTSWLELTHSQFTFSNFEFETTAFQANLKALFLSSRSALSVVEQFNDSVPRNERHRLLPTWTLAPVSKVKRMNV